MNTNVESRITNQSVSQHAPVAGLGQRRPGATLVRTVASAVLLAGLTLCGFALWKIGANLFARSVPVSRDPLLDSAMVVLLLTLVVGAGGVLANLGSELLDGREWARVWSLRLAIAVAVLCVALLATNVVAVDPVLRIAAIAAAVAGLGVSVVLSRESVKAACEALSAARPFVPAASGTPVRGAPVAGIGFVVVLALFAVLKGTDHYYGAAVLAIVGGFWLVAMVLYSIVGALARSLRASAVRRQLRVKQ